MPERIPWCRKHDRRLSECKARCDPHHATAIKVITHGDLQARAYQVTYRRPAGCWQPGHP